MDGESYRRNAHNHYYVTYASDRKADDLPIKAGLHMHGDAPCKRVIVQIDMQIGQPDALRPDAVSPFQRETEMRVAWVWIVAKTINDKMRHITKLIQDILRDGVNIVHISKVIADA